MPHQQLLTVPRVMWRVRQNRWSLFAFGEP